MTLLRLVPLGEHGKGRVRAARRVQAPHLQDPQALDPRREDAGGVIAEAITASFRALGNEDGA